MASNQIPSEPPPPYTAGPSTNAAPPTTNPQDASRLQVPHRTRSGIPPSARRSMEDEARELPTGWIRQYDSQTHHQFFVDTNSSPPRSIWHHPYDDQAFLSKLSSTERERVQNLHRAPTRADIEAESSGDDDHTPQQTGGGEELSGTKKFGRKMKDKLTGSTHQEREQARRAREEEERKLYARHLHIRKQMSLAAETGKPQLLGKDENGKEVWIEPPQDMGYGGMGGIGGMGAFGSGYGGRFGGGGGYAYNPYSQGVYSNPNARYIRPQGPYGRPYGMGYGGGYGLPIGLGLGGGLLAGSLLF